MSTLSKTSSSKAFVISFHEAGTRTESLTSSQYVRCVR
jgi:hypothetical protein